jgi:YesN/AraC family two-component response regulator
MGLEVVGLAVNGQEAVNSAREFKPQIICLDVDMPVMSGLEALPLIRQVSPLSSVVMVTGSATREFVQKAAAMGAKGYIVKPVRPAYVEAFIRKLLS